MAAQRLGSAKFVWFAAAAGVAAITVGSFLMLRPGGEAQPFMLRPDDAQIVARGEAVYVEHCAACHGVDLQGQANWRQRRPDGRLPAPPHDENGHTWHHPDQMLIALTKHGPSIVAGPDYPTDMPAYETLLDDAEIVAVLSYIKSRWPRHIRQRHDQLNTAR